MLIECVGLDKEGAIYLEVRLKFGAQNALITRLELPNCVAKFLLTDLK